MTHATAHGPGVAFTCHAACTCSYCRQAYTRHVQPAEPRPTLARAARVLPARKPNEKSRYREGPWEIWRVALGVYAAECEQAPERESRANFEPKADPLRVHFDPGADRGAVLSHLQARKVRPELLKFVGGREDWLCGVWLELVNPRADIEQPADLWVRVDRAVWRYEKSERKQMDRFCLPQTVLLA